MRSARSCGFFKPANTILVPAQPHEQSNTIIASHSTARIKGLDTRPTPNVLAKQPSQLTPAVCGLYTALVCMLLREQRTHGRAAEAHQLCTEDVTPGMYFFGACANAPESVSNHTRKLACAL